MQGVLIKQVDPVEPLTKGKALAWYEAESYETYSYFSRESANKWSPIINNPHNEDLIEERQRIIKDYYKLLSNIHFRRINADRDIVPEVESDGAELGFNGSGTTNLIRRFIIDAAYDEKIVEEILLSELNKIMGPDAQFERIHVQQFTEGDIKKWEVYLQEKGQPRFPLTNDIGRYEIISDYLKGIRNDFSFVKVPFARKVAPHITKADFRDDLEEKIRELATKIKKWNE